jgi:DnaK suppressor protein
MDHEETDMALTPRAEDATLSAVVMAGLRERLQTQVAQLQAKAANLRGELSAADADTSNTFVAGVEGAMVAEENDDIIALLRHEQQEWQAAQAALARMAQGDYGLCEGCGAPIGLARLEILPEATLCIDCQAAEERHARR